MAIQVLGGSGYIREYPLERLYRDQRLNPIHEGAEGIHLLDLLGRKVGLHDGGGYRAFRQGVDEAVAAGVPDADFYRGKLQAARYYVEWELPVVRSQCELLRAVNAVPLDMRDGWFQ